MLQVGNPWEGKVKETVMDRVKQIELHSWLIDRIGWKEFVSMCREFGGQRVWIPKEPYTTNRNIEIRKQYNRIMDHGNNLNQQAIYDSLAKQFGMTESGIRHVLFD